MKINFVIPYENNEMCSELDGIFRFAIAIINNISNSNSGSMESTNIDMLRLRSHLKRNQFEQAREHGAEAGAIALPCSRQTNSKTIDQNKHVICVYSNFPFDHTIRSFFPSIFYFIPFFFLVNQFKIKISNFRCFSTYKMYGLILGLFSFRLPYKCIQKLKLNRVDHRASSCHCWVGGKSYNATQLIINHVIGQSKSSITIK